MPEPEPWSQTRPALDQPVTASFFGSWKRFANRPGRASILPADIGDFASMGEAEFARADFVSQVLARRRPVIVLQVDAITPPAGLQILEESRGLQMVFHAESGFEPDTAFSELGPDDYPEMLRLAELTRPGPFQINTGRLGSFIGQRRDGELVAMAGERMGFPGWREISAICVHPDFRGRGLAHKLIAQQLRRLATNGETAFLHTYASNRDAIRLYQRIGFETRAVVRIAMIASR